MSEKWKFIFLFLFLLAFRTAFGLSAPFFSPDELQTYLIGLKCYSTGTWPFYGPDLIVTETGFQTQIPGALEGLLIGLPFHILPIPEAPFVLLNFLSLAGLSLFAWTLSRRLPDIPFPFILAWLALLPWNLHESTNTINPSYLLFGSCLFFTGFLEAIPGLSLGLLGPFRAFALMGFGLFWDMQFHFSWILLPPFVLAAFVLQGIRPFPSQGEALNLPRALGGFLAGSLFPLAFLLPTLVRDGFSHGASGMSLAVSFNPDNFASFFTLLARFLSLACFELPRFIGLSGAERWDFLKDPLVLLPGLTLMVLGFIQPLVLLAGGFRKDPRRPGSVDVRLWTLGAFLLVWASFWFTSKPPAAHIYYILIPLVCLYSFYIGGLWASKPWWRILAAACILLNVWFETGYMVRKWGTQSLYLDRSRAAEAVQKRDYRILGERRPGSLY